MSFAVFAWVLILGLAYWVSSYTEGLRESETGVVFEQERPWQAPSPQVRSSERSPPPGYEKVNGIAGNLMNIVLGGRVTWFDGGV